MRLALSPFPSPQTRTKPNNSEKKIAFPLNVGVNTIFKSNLLGYSACLLRASAAKVPFCSKTPRNPISLLVFPCLCFPKTQDALKKRVNHQDFWSDDGQSQHTWAFCCEVAQGIFILSNKQNPQTIRTHNCFVEFSMLIQQKSIQTISPPRINMKQSMKDSPLPVVTLALPNSL